jgi:hypothetical protein
VSVARSAVKTIALSFPGANEQLKHGGTAPHFYIGRKFFTWIREEENSLALRLDSMDERDALIESDPRLFHITDHYRNWPSVLVRLDRATPRLIRGMLERRFRDIATKKLLKEWEARQSQPTRTRRRSEATERGPGHGQGS